MKKFVIFLISATLLASSVNLYAQNPSCKWNGTPPQFGNLLNNTDNIIINEGEGCQFRFELKSPTGFGWFPDERIDITVDGIDYGSVTLPWLGTPYAEEIKLLPSGEVQFTWIGTYSPNNCFKIYNHENEMIYESPLGLEEGLFFTYQNECPECLPLTHFEGVYISELKQVNLSWTAPESEYLTGFNILRNDSLIEHITKTTNFYSDNTSYLEDGDYKYCVVPVYPYSCTFEKKCFETYISNVGIKSYFSALRLYPNPANNELRITNYELREGVIEIYDVYGRRLLSNHLIPSLSHHTIDISSLSSGVYFVTLTNEQNVYIQRFIKY